MEVLRQRPKVERGRCVRVVVEEVAFESLEGHVGGVEGVGGGFLGGWREWRVA